MPKVDKDVQGVTERKKRRAVRHDPVPGSIVRGTRLRLYVKPEQAETLDLWRRRTRELWNLLLRLERAAYSGAQEYPAIGWREIWEEVAQINHALGVERWERRLADGDEGGKEPVVPPTDKILARGLKEEPRLFIWENDLQKLMARLKKVPHTRWIGDLPSHAAQHVVKDLVKALQAMLRERKRRTAGASERQVGFPRFKKNHYASGSVYFANTQIAFDYDKDKVRFPSGVGWVKYAGSIAKGNKLMGARAWRRGEDWWLSVQFEMPGPAHLPLTGREVGLKVAAGTLATVYDGAAFDQTITPREDKRRTRRLKLWGRKLARRLDAQAAKTRRLARRGKTSRRKHLRLPRSAGFYEASQRLAVLQAHEADQRNDLLHKASRNIVDGADHLSIERIDVAGMMKRQDQRALKRQRRRDRLLAATGEALLIRHKAPAKVLRKASRRAAMARFLCYVKYKAEDAGRTVTETHTLMPRVQKCGGCGHLNAVMKDGRLTHRCARCDGMMRRQENAADNMHQLGVISRTSGLEAAE